MGLGALLAGGATSLLSSGASIFNTQKTIKANKEMARYAYEKDLEMWRRQNEYNNPANQMARLKDAGLNPHLVYGTGTVTGNTGGQMPKYQAPKLEYNYKPPQIPETIGAFQNLEMRQAQIDNVKAQTKNTDARTATEFVRKSKFISDKQKVDISNAVASELMETQVETGKTSLDMLKKRLTHEQKKMIYTELKNELQRERNKWEKYGVQPRDKLLIRAAIKILEGLDLDTSFVWKLLPEGTRGILKF